MALIPRFILERLKPLPHRIRALPIVVLMPTSQCNCKCVMCDYWKTGKKGDLLSLDLLERQLEDFKRLGVQWFLLSGGEALLHPELWSMCRLIKRPGVKISLLTNGLQVEEQAADIVEHCHEVILSLDGSRDVHDAIRKVPGAFDRLAEGVAVLKSVRPLLTITGRCVIQKANFTDLPGIIDAAHAPGLERLSFLSVDVSTEAFDREGANKSKGADRLALDREERKHFKGILDATFKKYARDFASGFIAESPAKLSRLHAYFSAVQGEGAFPPVACNAPWVSCVIEADGAVRPCFFHAPYGNLHEASLEKVLNSEAAVAFRKNLKVKKNSLCQKCVCSLYLRGKNPGP